VTTFRAVMIIVSCNLQALLWNVCWRHCCCSLCIFSRRSIKCYGLEDAPLVIQVLAIFAGERQWTLFACTLLGNELKPTLSSLSCQTTRIRTAKFASMRERQHFTCNSRLVLRVAPGDDLFCSFVWSRSFWDCPELP
jgi:hypothetical protein